MLHYTINPINTVRKLFMFLAVCLIAIQFSSCKKDKSSRNYADLLTYSQTVHLPAVTVAQMQLLYDTASVERDLFMARFQQDHPGLKAQMDNDAAVILQTTDSATRIQLMNSFITTYHAKVLDSWNLSGINTNSLRSQYAAVLGNIPFNMGEFGTVTFTDSTVTGSNPPVFPDDSFTDFQECPVVWHTDGCGGLSTNTYSNNSNNSIIDMVAGVAGGCDITLSSGAVIDLPNNVYKFISGIFSFGYSTLDCMAFAAIGGSCSSATLSAVMEADGVPLTSRDVYSIHAVAPVIWYATAHQDIPFSTKVIVSARNDSGLSMGNYKTYLQARNTVASGAVIAVAQSRCFYIRRAAIRMTR